MNITPAFRDWLMLSSHPDPYGLMREARERLVATLEKLPEPEPKSETDSQPEKDTRAE